MNLHAGADGITMPRLRRHRGRVGVWSVGFTTLELLLTVSLIALATTLAGVAFRTLRQTEGERVLQALYATRATAVISGKPATWSEGGHVIHFYPDGSSGGGVIAVGDQRFEVDCLTGVVHVAP